MPKFHVCNTRSRSGISRYAESFYRVALRRAGYVHLEPDEVDEAMARCGPSSGAVWHVELGAHQYPERDAYVKLVNAGHRSVDVTLHEPPFLTFPFFHFRSPVANRISRGVDWYLDSFGRQTRYMKKARRVFVLSERGADWVRRKRGLSNVTVIPQVVEPASVWSRGPDERVKDVLFFGFIGRSKGLEYALALHAAIRSAYPDVGMHVVGQAAGTRDQAALDALLEAYPDGVEHYGYVAEAALDGIFSRCAHVFLPYARFRYFCPVSASVLAGLRRGRVVWVSDVNAMRETIVPGVNGLIFSGDVPEDLATYRWLREEPERQAAIAARAIETARAAAAFDYGRYFAPDGRAAA